MTGILMTLGGIVLLAAILWRRGIWEGVSADNTRTEHRSVPRDGVQTVDLRLRLGAGILTMQGGAAGLVDAVFVNNGAELDPEFLYRVADGAAEISIIQPAGHIVALSPLHAEWNLRCADGFPLTLGMTTGAGTTSIDLSTSLVRRLQVRTGAGQGTMVFPLEHLQKLSMATGAGRVNLHLTGTPEMPMRGDIRSGVGALLILLPKATPTRIHVERGLGAVNAPGFWQNRNDYLNYAPGGTPFVDLTVCVGMGEVTLQLF